MYVGLAADPVFLKIHFFLKKVCPPNVLKSEPFVLILILILIFRLFLTRGPILQFYITCNTHATVDVQPEFFFRLLT